MLRTPRLTAVCAILLASAACSPPPEPPPAPRASGKSITADAPPIDAESIQAQLGPEQTLEVVSFANEDATRLSGEVIGYAAKVYAVAVRAGQTLSVTYLPSNNNLYMNISDAAVATGEAVHRGQADGAGATLTPETDTVYLIKPFQTRATARRNERGHYDINLRRN